MNNETDMQTDEQAESTEENVCPPGFYWDKVKQGCVQIIVDEEEE